MNPTTPSQIQTLLNQAEKQISSKKEVGLSEDGRLIVKSNGSKVTSEDRLRLANLLNQVHKDEKTEHKLGKLQKRAITKIQVKDVKKILADVVRAQSDQSHPVSSMPEKAKKRLMGDSDSTEAILSEINELATSKQWDEISKRLPNFSDIELLDHIAKNYDNSEDYCDEVPDRIQQRKHQIIAQQPLSDPTADSHAHVMFQELATESQHLHNDSTLVKPSLVTGGCRFKNTRPPVQTAVRDPEIKGNYYQANYIDNTHIAAQGPMTNDASKAAMWAMLVNENATALVNLTMPKDTNEPGGKDLAVEYWPSAGQEAKYGNVTVKNVKEESHKDYKMITVQLSREGSEPREVKVFHYTGWPDHKIPSNQQAFNAFHQQLESFDGKMVVHCKAGVGRTGSEIVWHQLKKLINSDRSITADNLKEKLHGLIMEGRKARGQQFVEVIDQVSWLLKTGLHELETRGLYAQVIKKTKSTPSLNSQMSTNSAGIKTEQAEYDSGIEEGYPELQPESVKVTSDQACNQKRDNFMMQEAQKGGDWFDENGALKRSEHDFFTEIYQLSTGELRALSIAPGCPLSTKKGYKKEAVELVHEAFSHKLIDDLVSKHGVDQVEQNIDQIKYFTPDKSGPRNGFANDRLRQWKNRE